MLWWYGVRGYQVAKTVGGVFLGGQGGPCEHGGVTVLLLCEKRLHDLLQWHRA